MDAPATMPEPDRRRRIRRTALLLSGFALLVYVGFIVIFVSSHS
jgi:hypothetical protein